MAHTYHDLKLKTVAELREIAAGLGDDAVQGYSQLNKDHLLVALCKALHIDAHEHHEAVGIDKSAIKQQIRALKLERDAALSAHDHDKLKTVRRRMHRLKRRIRRAQAGTPQVTTPSAT
jgi:hypothetical protein